MKPSLLALAMAVLLGFPIDGAVALPGQAPEEVTAALQKRGWHARTGEFTPGTSYGLGRGTDWRPLSGKIYQEQRMFTFFVGEDERIEREGLRLTVDWGYVDGDVHLLKGLWLGLVREVYPEDMVKEIFEATPVGRLAAAVTPKSGAELHRVTVLEGRAYAYVVTVTESFTDASCTAVDPESRVRIGLDVYPRARLGDAMNRLAGYSRVVFDETIAPMHERLRDHWQEKLVERKRSRSQVPIPLDAVPGSAAQETAGAPWRLAERYAGIGIEIKKSRTRLWIMRVLPGGPAWDAGIRAEDEIIFIDRTPVAPLSVEQATAVIRGPVDSQVVLTIDCAGSVVRVPVTRRAINAVSH